jgi:hypothetical protein
MCVGGDESMHFPWANIILLVLLFIQLITGYFGFTNGRASFSWILWLHGIGAYGLIVLLYWKSSIIFDTLRRKKTWTRQRVGFIALLLLLLATLAAGLVWTFYGPIYLYGFSLVSIHIYLAIPLMVLLIWHSWHMRYIFRVRQTWGRRFFLQAAFTTVTGMIVWRSVNTAKRYMQLPGAKRRFTGSFERGSFSGIFPSVSWIADKPAPVDVERWRLTLDGYVEQTVTLTYDGLERLATKQLVATLDCTGGWYTTQVWHGVEMSRLIEMAGPGDGATSVTVTAVSGYERRFTLEEVQHYLLALGVAGEPLQHSHGHPARLVAPDQRGVNWVKWVARIRVNRSPKWWQSPLPLR